jgi:hypothetical protein
MIQSIEVPTSPLASRWLSHLYKFTKQIFPVVIQLEHIAQDLEIFWVSNLIGEVNYIAKPLWDYAFSPFMFEKI